MITIIICHNNRCHCYASGYPPNLEMWEFPEPCYKVLLLLDVTFPTQKTNTFSLCHLGTFELNRVIKIHSEWRGGQKISGLNLRLLYEFFCLVKRFIYSCNETNSVLWIEWSLLQYSSCKRHVSSILSCFRSNQLGFILLCQTSCAVNHPAKMTNVASIITQCQWKIFFYIP